MSGFYFPFVKFSIVGLILSYTSAQINTLSISLIKKGDRPIAIISENDLDACI